MRSNGNELVKRNGIVSKKLKPSAVPSQESSTVVSGFEIRIAENMSAEAGPHLFRTSFPNNKYPAMIITMHKLIKAKGEFNPV
jgi:hypothetical protein